MSCEAIFQFDLLEMISLSKLLCICCFKIVLPYYTDWHGLLRLSATFDLSFKIFATTMYLTVIKALFGL